MPAKPIYVELEMNTDMETIWTHTQTPGLHRQWDLRFSDITYLPRIEGEELQHFRYETRIGFGLRIAGKGITRETKGASRSIGQRVSALAFGSEQRLSLIREGSGYWKYQPKADGVVFVTQYDYRTRYGWLGRAFDRLLFRPLFGYATAWSFDRLRLWLEKGIPPTASMQLALAHYSSVILLVLLWFYEGLVPKLLYPMSGEVALLQATGWLQGWERYIVSVTGIVEIGIAVLVGWKHRNKEIYSLQTLLLAILAFAALFARSGLIQTPFNPVPLAVAMMGLGFIASVTTTDLPNAANCHRRKQKQD
jgi:hypothetical protein